MAKRTEAITEESLGALYRHHPYLLIFQKEDWREYLLLLARIYDVLEEQGKRVSIDIVRAIALRFYSVKSLSFVDQKVLSFFSMAIGELQVLADSHDQFGQRYIETTRSGKLLLQLMESLLSERGKFSGTGAETLLGALNDILISRRQMTQEEAIQHHKERIEAYRDDLARLKKDGLAAAQLLPMAHSNEALFSQAEEAANHISRSIEDVKSAIERQRRDLADGYFQTRRSAGETLGAVADFYDRLYESPEYASYVQAKQLLSHLEGFQARFGQRNVDRLLQLIGDRDLLPPDAIRRSNLRSFMRQFSVADASIQEKIKAQIRILQQQVLYSVTTDVEGLRSGLHSALSALIANSGSALEFFESSPIVIPCRDEFEAGPVELFDFEAPTEVPSQAIEEETFDLVQERELFLALIRAEEGTLKDILARLLSHLREHGELRAAEHRFPRGLAEYYVLSEIDLFREDVEKVEQGEADLRIDSKYGSYFIRRAPAFSLRMKKERSVDG